MADTDSNIVASMPASENFDIKGHNVSGAAFDFDGNKTLDQADFEAFAAGARQQGVPNVPEYDPAIGIKDNFAQFDAVLADKTQDQLTGIFTAAHEIALGGTPPLGPTPNGEPKPTVPRRPLASSGVPPGYGARPPSLLLFSPHPKETP